MALIQFVNNEAPYLNAENLNDNFNYLEEKIDNKNAITARMQNDYSLNEGDVTETLPINVIDSQIGQNLTLEDDGIRIGEGINYVAVSGQIYYYANVKDKEMLCYIYKNGANMMTHNSLLSDNYEHVSLPIKVIPVAEGDIITLRVRHQGSFTSAPLIKNYGTGTFLTVVAL